ncbi:roadblock/LC7 domain-containing protein [Streptomyces sp. NPDC059816]|uniref:roadblock/LC7 domain-containing protein n=1 Tax=Streptomyces sp. NPDC059816 TaxID=3346960 RepID=UPI00366464D1
MTEKPDWLLKSFAEENPGTIAVVLTSSDGLLMASHGLERDSAERVGAMVSGSAALGRSLGQIPGLESPQGTHFEQMTVCHGGLWMLVGHAGKETYLAVLTVPDADIAPIAHAMTRLSDRLYEHLSTKPRTSTAH